MGKWYERCDMCYEMYDLDDMVRYRGYDRKTGEPEPDNIWRWIDKRCNAWIEKYNHEMYAEAKKMNS
jgi:hypothetical protein